MVTVYDKKGNPTELDGCDARERVDGGLATYDDPAAEKPEEAVVVDVDKPVVDLTMKEMKAELKAANVKFKANESKYDLQAMVTGLRAS